MAPSLMLALTLAHFLISFACGQMTNTSSNSCPVTLTQQLTVNGCPVFVHDVTGAKDFVIEPLMCITQNINNVVPRVDPLTQKMFVSVPVTLRDDAMLEEIRRQLQSLSPNSINFAAVSDIRVSMDASSKCVQALMFMWGPEEPVGYLRLGGLDDTADCRSFFLTLETSIFDAINAVILTAKVTEHNEYCEQTELEYKLVLQNQSVFHADFYGSKLECRSDCNNLKFFQPVISGQFIARVHQRQDINSIFYVEPLLYPKDIGKSDSIVYDYSRVMFYLKLDVVLQDNDILNAVQKKLANLSPTEVSFMQLRGVEITVSSLFRSRFEIGPLMVSGDRRSGQVRLYCKTYDDCKLLRLNMTESSLNFWSHVKFHLTSHTPNQCIVKSVQFRLLEVSNSGLLNSRGEIVEKLTQGIKYQTKIVNGIRYAIIQQRISASVSFARTWYDYEIGFGDETNFWIGLSKIHLLSIKGVTLRVEMKLMENGNEYHQEYPNFKVGDASTKYTMTCGFLNTSRSNTHYDALYHNNGTQFSTMDIDNDNWPSHCSTVYGGNGGWWFNACSFSAPNNVYGAVLTWNIYNVGWKALSEVRLMLQI